MKIEKSNILIVDDELGLREGIRRILEMHGHNVETADTGTLGIEKGISKEYDLYLIDLKMPDIEGTQVLREIKLAFPEAICVIITAYASIETAIETTRLGAYHYLPKPFEPDELLILVNRALERRWYVNEARRLNAEQERSLLELSTEKSRAKTIINALDDGILVVNQEEQVVLFNPAFLYLLDIKEKIIIGDEITSLLPELLRNQIREIFANNDGSFQAIQQEIVIKPPAESVVMANTTAIRGSDGELQGVVSVLRDITELKRIDVLKSQFVNMAAHELKSPLTAVQGFLELVVDQTLGDDPEAYKNYLERALNRTKALVSLINDLLNISRLEAGTVRRVVKQYNLSEILDETLQSFKDRISEKNLVLKLDIAPDLPVNIDRDEVLRVFHNLISNAIKYNCENGQIEINAALDGYYIKTEIKDSGIGLKPEEKTRLFEDFFRAKNEHTRTIAGTGLGLTIVKKIVDAYAGTIDVESEYEKGSTFCVYLPIAENDD